MPKKEKTKKTENIDNKELMAIFCERHKTTWFISDASTLLQQHDLFEDGKLLTPGYGSQLAEAIYKLAVKQMSLYEQF